MRTPLLFLLLLFSFTLAAQTKIETLVKEGVDLHDRGYYEDALVKYDSALALDKTNYLAGYEKAYTLMHLKRYDHAVELCKYLLSNNKSAKSLYEIYILHGNALDMLGKKKESIDVFDDGIKAFPNVSLLHFNKAITLFGMDESQKGLEATKAALLTNPKHASSHNLMLNLHRKTNKVLALMAAVGFLAFEPEGQRAVANLSFVKVLLTAEAKKSGDNSYNVDMDLGAMLMAGKKKDDNFSSSDLILTLIPALNVEEKNSAETMPKRLERNMKSVIASLKEGQKEGKGFGWDFYAPFLVAIEKDRQLETLSHLMFVSDDDAENNKWLSEHKEEVDAFYKWLNVYQWPKLKL